MYDMNVQCFYAVAESGSFSRAAEILFLTQPSVSRNIKVLEAELGYTLFRRTTRSVQLTPQGEMLFEVLKKTMAIWQAGLKEVQAAGRGLTGRLRIGLLNGWVLERLPIIDTFQRRYPGVQIEIHKFRYLELAEMLLRGALDLIIVTVPPIDLEKYFALQKQVHISSSTIFRAPMLICASIEHPAAAGASTIQQLGALNLFVLSPEHHPSAYAVNSALIRDNQWSLNIIHAPNTETIRTAVDRQQGCTLSSVMYLPLDYRCYYKTFHTGLLLDTFCTWNHDTDNKEIVELFMQELAAAPVEEISIVD
ncbi:MAG: LysR family transcriptional regulator [Ruminococcaceae bacterium]|nr:LysR family transcriptional regulator [Oscillospiraceae bacterium]